MVFKTIKMGATGPKVEDIQKLLKKAGSSIKVNGEFGIGMHSAVKAFQKKNGLKMTGEVDSATMKKLNALKTTRKK